MYNKSAQHHFKSRLYSFLLNKRSVLLKKNSLKTTFGLNYQFHSLRCELELNTN